MKMKDSAEIYEVKINGTTYCFQYPDPSTWNSGKTFYGVATVWEKGTKDSFTVPYYVKADDIDQVHFRIIKGIEEHLKK
jgi:hypothetical protein